MDPITLIVAALAAGASGGAISALQDDVKGAVIAAYGKLRGLVGKRVAGNPGPSADAATVLRRRCVQPGADTGALADRRRALMDRYTYSIRIRPT